MKLSLRLMLGAIGLLAIALAAAQLHAGNFVFTSVGYHQTTFAAAGIGTGVLMIGLALLPRGDWLYKRITTKRMRK